VRLSRGPRLKKLLFVTLVALALAAYYAHARFSAEPQGGTQLPTAQVLTVAGQPVKDAASKAPVQELSEDERLLDQGRQAAKAGNIAAAEEAFGDLMKRLPTDPVGAQAAVEMALIYKNAGDPFNERNSLAFALAGLPDGDTRDQVIGELHKINGELVFSKKPAQDSQTYTVKSGDSLARIAARLKITAELIRRINYLTSDRIYVGETLKVFQGPFDMVIEKSKFRLTAYRAGVFVREYKIGIGKNGSTPEGEFAVENKLIDPVWDPPGPEYAASKAPDNPLGSRWIGFNREYGIHGTIDAESIGRAESRGCIRLMNSDVEELYNLVVIGSKVTVKP